MVTSSSQPAVHCVENIALLELLHSVSYQPSRNEVSISKATEGNYTLSLEQERKLTGTLAFLANIKDGRDHIPAICIREDDIKGLIEVVVAVNKQSANDGNEVLQDLKQGYERLFTLLHSVSSGQFSGMLPPQRH